MYETWIEPHPLVIVNLLSVVFRLYDFSTSPIRPPSVISDYWVPSVVVKNVGTDSQYPTTSKSPWKLYYRVPTDY